MTSRDGKGGPRYVSLLPLIIFQLQMKETAEGYAHRVLPCSPSSSHTCLLHPPPVSPFQSSLVHLPNSLNTCFRHTEKERVWWLSEKQAHKFQMHPGMLCGLQSLSPPTGHVEVLARLSSRSQNPMPSSVPCCSGTGPPHQEVLLISHLNPFHNLSLLSLDEIAQELPVYLCLPALSQT